MNSLRKSTFVFEVYNFALNLHNAQLISQQHTRQILNVMHQEIWPNKRIDGKLKFDRR